MRKMILSMMLLLLTIPIQIQAIEIIEEEQTSPASIDLSQDEELNISWNQKEAAKVTVYICDLDGSIVKTLIKKEELASGQQELIWDGTSTNKKDVPEGVYFPIITALIKKVGSDTFNPTSSAWGNEVVVEDVSYDSVAQNIQYTIYEQAMVRVRVGGKNGGPMYKSISSWQVKEAGTHEVAWDGMDAANVVDAKNKQNLQISVDAFSLPVHSVVVTGSTLKKGKGNSEKYKHYPVHRPRGKNISHFTRIPYGLLPDPEIEIIFNKKIKQNNNAYDVQGIITIEVDITNGFLGEAPKESIELYAFMDEILAMEGPEDGLPASLELDTTNYKNGLHVLTINLRTSGDRTASFSAQINVSN